MRTSRASLLCGALVALAFGAAAAGQDRETDLDQGWSDQQVQTFYGAFQGSRLIPHAWLQALERPDGSGMFLDPAYIESFRYLTRPGDLPVGFAIDVQDDSGFTATKLRWKRGQGSSEPWVGLTCSACHTAELRSGPHRIRVQGGPTLADFQGFMGAFNQALVRTSDDAAAFDRFALKVLGPAPAAHDKRMLKTALAKLVAQQLQMEAMNRTELAYGFGRLDAVGHIYNKTAQIADPRSPTVNPPDAPVSYPFLWNTAQQTRIQWDGIATNTPRTFASGQTLDVGALGRNVGEVTGVFGDVTAPGFLRPLFRSSIRVSNLVSIEQQLMSLRPPRWPRALFPVDEALAAEGRTLFGARCASCHFTLPRNDLTTRARPDGSPVESMSFMRPQKPGETAFDTDPWMACNAAVNQADTGSLKGKRTGVGAAPKLGAQAPLSLILRTVITGEIVSRSPELVLAGIESFRGTQPPPQVGLAAPPGRTDEAPSPRQARLLRCQQYAASSPGYQDVAYKARPLAGVWATGPFLHNGSVPTLFDLLLAPSQRPTTFNLGSREFDPVKVGFVTAPGPDNSFVFQVRDPSGAIIEGNSNQGHDYGASSFTDRQRLALVEYLKVIGE